MSDRPVGAAARGWRRPILVATFAAATILASGSANADTGGNGGGGPAGGAFMSSYSKPPAGSFQRQAPIFEQPVFEPPTTGSVSPVAEPRQSEPRRLPRRR